MINHGWFCGDMSKINYLKGGNSLAAGGCCTKLGVRIGWESNRSKEVIDEILRPQFWGLDKFASALVILLPTTTV